MNSPPEGQCLPAKDLQPPKTMKKEREMRSFYVFGGLRDSRSRPS